jgi:hypothetical protein
MLAAQARATRTAPAPAGLDKKAAGKSLHRLQPGGLGREEGEERRVDAVAAAINAATTDDRTQRGIEVRSRHEHQQVATMRIETERRLDNIEWTLAGREVTLASALKKRDDSRPPDIAAA